jgi:hypothetical protein
MRGLVRTEVRRRRRGGRTMTWFCCGTPNPVLRDGLGVYLARTWFGPVIVLRNGKPGHAASGAARVPHGLPYAVGTQSAGNSRLDARRSGPLVTESRLPATARN